MIYKHIEQVCGSTPIKKEPKRILFIGPGDCAEQKATKCCVL